VKGWSGALALALLNFPALAAGAATPEAPHARTGTDGFQSAEALYSYCKGSAVSGQEYCFAYIAAVADTVRAYQAWLNLSDVCLRQGVSQGALRDIFADYLGRNPGLGHNQAASVVVLALQDRFACKPAAAPTPPPQSN